MNDSAIGYLIYHYARLVKCIIIDLFLTTKEG